jgi:hypothetical protein
MPLLSASPYAILPFIVEDSTMPLNRDNSVTFDLRIDPADVASPTVRYALRKITGVENTREVITWAHALKTRVFPGMGATTGPGQLRLMDAVLEGTPRFLCMENSGTYANANRAQRALRALQNGQPQTAHDAIMASERNDPENLTVEVIDLLISDIIHGMVPRHAITHVKRYLSREFLKPKDWSVRDYYQRLKYINTVELPLLPGNQENFSAAELKEILLVATPPEWRREMYRMGFDALHSNNEQVLHFMENLEAAERAERAMTMAPPRGMLARFNAFTHGFGRRNENL